MKEVLRVPKKAVDVCTSHAKGYKSLEYLALVYLVGTGSLPKFYDTRNDSEGWCLASYDWVLRPLFRSRKPEHGNVIKNFEEQNGLYGYIERRVITSRSKPLAIHRLTELGEVFMSEFQTDSYMDKPSVMVDVRKEKPLATSYPDRCFNMKDAKGRAATLPAYKLPTKVAIDKEMTKAFMQYVKTLKDVRFGDIGHVIVPNNTLPLEVVQEAFGCPDMTTEEGKDRERARLNRLLGQTVRLLDNASIGGDWCLPQQMEQKNSGRYYGYNNTAFTNTTRPLRKCLLNKYYCLDMENAQLAMLAQLAKDFGEWESIHYYLENKSEVRDTMSAALNIPVADFKQAILSSVFGSSPSGITMRRIMPDAETRLRFVELNQGLLDDIKQAKTALVNHARETMDGGVVFNMNGKPMVWDDITVEEDYFSQEKGSLRPATEAEKYRKVAAHLLQGAESRLLKEVLSIEGYGNKVITTIHDSIVTTMPIDPESLRLYLLEATGLDVSWSYEHIPTEPCAKWAGNMKSKVVKLK